MPSSKILATETLDFWGIPILIQYKNVKNINLRVSLPDGRVSISVPIDIDLTTIRLFVVSKLVWIESKQAKYQTRKPRSTRKPVADEEFEVDDILVTVRRKAIKNINLRVSPPDGDVSVSAPLDTKLEDIREFVDSKLPWIESKRLQYQDDDDLEWIDGSPAEDSIEVNGTSIPIQRKDIKNINLRVTPPDGKIGISAPFDSDRDTIRSFVTSHLKWIERKQAEYRDPTLRSPHTYLSGELHDYRGQRCCLHIHPTTDGRSRVELNDDPDSSSELHLYAPPDATAIDRESILYDWYRQQFKRLLPNLVAKWKPAIGVSVNEARIKRMKTKWGTCNIPARRIWLNLELIKAPPQCLEYVVVHEMTHLLERLHNQRFYSLLEEFFPTYKEAEKMLKQMGINEG